MKSTHLPLKGKTDAPKTLLKKLQLAEQSNQKVRIPPRLRSIQSVKAGRVRGGHSFH